MKVFFSYNEQEILNTKSQVSNSKRLYKAIYI